MSMEEYTKVLLGPVVSEKAYTAQQEANQYVFRVHPDATKPQIKAAVKKLFGVKVVKVQVINMPGKPKRRGWLEGRRPGYRKAIVRLAEGQALDPEQMIAEEEKEG